MNTDENLKLSNLIYAILENSSGFKYLLMSLNFTNFSYDVMNMTSCMIQLLQIEVNYCKP